MTHTRNGKSSPRRKIAASLALILLLQLLLSAFAPGTGRVHAEEAAPEASAAPATKYITFLYNDFTQSASRLKFNGSAKPEGTALRLTPAKPDLFGSVFNKERVWLKDNAGFSTYFTFQLTDQGHRPGFANGADGIVFTLQTQSNNAGGIGSGIGYQGIQPSIGIEFDTYPNGESPINDPNDNHVAIDFNGSVNHSGPGAVAEPVDLDFKSGNPVHAWIDYKADTGRIEVYLSEDATRPAQPAVSQDGIDLIGLLKSDYVYAGFTSATGSAWENHDITQWYFTNRFDPIDASCGCYKEAPSLFKAKTDVDETAADPVFDTELSLTDLAGEPGPGIDLILSDVNNATFLDPDAGLTPLAEPPALKTDAEGKAHILFRMTDPQGPLPSFRARTEFGAYQDIQITTKPKTATGEMTPIYSSAGADQQAASAQVQLIATGGEPVTSWGVEYREKKEDGSGDWTTVTGSPAVIDEPNLYPVSLTGLKEDTYYEARAFASNLNGTAYGDPSTFIVQMPMAPGDVKYTRVGPSKIYYEDERSLQLVGENLNMLLKKVPLSDLKVSVTGNRKTYDVPRSRLQLGGPTSLKIALPNQENGDPLPLGQYSLSIGHAYFGSKTFDNAFEITNDASYRSIDYDSVVVENHARVLERDHVESIELRGPFVERATEPNVYYLREPGAVITLNDNLLFKGTELVVDKSDPDNEVIRGKGRFFVNGTNAIPLMTTFTVYEGEFEFEPDDFSFKVPPLVSKAFDYTGMSLPVSIESFTFIKGGIRITGDAQVEVGVGSKAKIEGKAEVDALEFKKNRFDLAANFAIGTELKTGPLESGEVRFGVDTRVPQLSAGASALLKKAKIGFDIDLTIKAKKLDAISFAVRKEMKLGSTGAQLTKIGGGVSNMTSLSEAPLTFSVLGGLSDYITPKIDNTYMVNGNDLRIDLSANHFGASGKLAIYKINVANVDLFVVFNPTGYRGYNRAGFDLGAQMNVLDIVVGSLSVKYFEGSSFSGYAKSAIQIPRSVKLIGGQKLSSAEVGVNSTQMKAALSIIGIGFTVKYPFKTKSFDWDVDLSSTVKNVANAVVNTGKKIIKAVSSWFWYGSPTDLGSMSFAYDSEAWARITGEKLFDASGMNASGRGVVIPGELSAIVVDNNPKVAKTAAGRIRHTLTVSEPYSAIVALSGATSKVKLLKPNGAEYELRYADSGAASPNAVYDAASGTIVIDASLTKGDWIVESDASLTATAYKVLYRNAASSLAQLASKLNGAEPKPLIPASFPDRGRYLVEIAGGTAEGALLQADGRAYSLESGEGGAGRNSFWDAEDGKLYILAEVPAAGEWYVDAGLEAKASLYRMAPDVTLDRAIEWRNGSEFASAVPLGSIAGSQVLLEIDGASEATKLFKPDGTAYPFDFDKTSAGWNATFDAAHGVISALINVDQAGTWLVKSNGFTDVFGLTLNQKTTMAELNGAGVTYTYSLNVYEKGKYLFDIAGGDANTKIYDANGKEVPIVSEENNPARNAILDTENHSLMVTVDVAKAGTVKIMTLGRASIQQYELAPIPTVSVLSAAAKPALNSYEAAWQVDNAKPDTKVKLIMATSASEPIGQVLAEDLPASGIRTVTLPAGNLPGDYYLALVADSESYGPIFKVLADPLKLKAEKMLKTPTGLTATATGNGEITLRFTDAEYGQATAYRVLLADEEGNIDYNGTSFDYDVDASKGASQQFAVSGLAPGETYRFAVMSMNAKLAEDPATGETKVESLLVSAPTAIASVLLPVPNPAKLSLSVDTGGQTAVDRSYLPYYVKEADFEGLSEEQRQAQYETLTVTAADRVQVRVSSDQPASLRLTLNGTEIQPVAGDASLFDLGELPERDYVVEVEAANAGGDLSGIVRRLIVDRTAPYLYLKSPANGGLIEGDRARLEGVSENGVDLKVNGVTVPVDATGHFVYYAPIPADGILPLHLVATDMIGNVTEHRLEVVKGQAGEGEKSADLASFATDGGVFVTPFLTEETEYETSIDERSKQVRVWAVPVDPEATVTINGKPTDDKFSALVDVSDGAVVQAVVRAPDRTEKTYALRIGTESGLAALRSLELSGWTASGEKASEAPVLSPAFSSTRLAYEAEVGSETAAVSLTPAAAAAGSLVRVNGELAASGAESTRIALSAGSNTIKVEVLSPDEAKKESPDWTAAKTYEIRIDRRTSGDSQLGSLALEGIALTPGTFDGSVAEYSARVASGVSSATLSFQAADPAAAVELNGVAKGASASETVQLAEGANVFKLKVVAADGSSQTYTLSVYRDKPIAEALTLSELSLDKIGLTKPFSPWTRNYDAEKNTKSSAAKVTAKPAVAGTTVKVNGKPVGEDGTATVNLNMGVNAILIQLESADRTAANTYSIAIVRSFEGGGEATPTPAPSEPGTTETPSPAFSVGVNDSTNEKAAVAAATKENGRDILRVTFVKDELLKALEAEGTNPVITVNAGASADEVVGVLTADLVKKMQEKDAILYLNAGNSTYTLPTAALDIGQIAEAFGANVALGDVKVEVKAALATDAELAAIRGQAGKTGAEVVGTPTAFRVTYGHGGKTVEAGRFDRYVERAVVLPDNAGPEAITTGVRVQADGTLYHVPTYVKQAGGKYYAVMRSYTNSLYAVIKNESTFKDIQGKWSQSAIEDLASRLVVNGKSGGRFDPNGNVTRAEFASMAVRALGLAPQAGATGYSDVKATDWFAPYVAAAKSYGLVTGYADGTFGPGKTITRAEAVAIVGKAWTIAGKTGVAKEEAAAALEGVSDAADIPAWARESFGSAVRLGLLSGYADGSVKPLRTLTREETAAMLRSLLVQSGLIQP